MTLRMADSTNPADLPGGMDAYGGYGNGDWPDWPAIAGAHPGVPVVEFDVSGVGLGIALDIERGDASPSQFPLWWLNRCLSGVFRPIGYAAISDMPQVVGFANNARIARADYRLLSAHYGEGEHICGPGTCGSPIQCDGTQWVDWGTWDQSSLEDWFFASPPVVTPPPPPFVAPPPTVSPPTPVPGAPHMSIVRWSMTTGADGTGYVDIAIPAGCSRIVAGSADVAADSAFHPPHHDVDIDQGDATGPRDASGVVCAPCVNALPAVPGHQLLRVAGGAAQHFYTGTAICA